MLAPFESRKQLTKRLSEQIGFFCFDFSKMKTNFIYMYDQEKNSLKRLTKYGHDINDRAILMTNITNCFTDDKFVYIDDDLYRFFILKKILFEDSTIEKIGLDLLLSVGNNTTPVLINNESLERLKVAAEDYFETKEEAAAWILKVEML